MQAARGYISEDILHSGEREVHNDQVLSERRQQTQGRGAKLLAEQVGNAGSTPTPESREG